MNGTYETGARLIYKCDDSAGFGYVRVTCGEDRMWGPPNRECDGTLQRVCVCVCVCV